MQKKYKLFKQKGNKMTFTGTEKVIDTSNATELELLTKEAEDLTKKKQMTYKWVEAPSL